MNRRTATLLAAATLAPSGDNTQPWRFVVDGGGDSVALELDPARDPSPMNAGQRMSRLAVGAALETLLWAAGDLGLSTRLDPDPAPFLARVHLEGEPRGEVRPIVSARSTNRRPYDARPLDPETLGLLSRSTPEVDGVETHWVVGGDRLAALAGVIGRGDGLMFGHPEYRRAFLGNVRFDRPATESVDEGLSLGALELTGADRVALRLMRVTPDLILKLGRAAKVFAAKAHQLVVSSSGLCLVTAPDGSARSDLAAGRALQRAWLALTAEGLATQPMMSLPVLDNADPTLRASLGADRVRSLLDEFSALVPEARGRRPAWLMRFGTAPPPNGRTGRLPLGRVTSLGGAAGAGRGAVD